VRLFPDENGRFGERQMTSAREAGPIIRIWDAGDLPSLPLG